MADLKAKILNNIQKSGVTTVAEIVSATGFSRAYVNRFFQQLRDEGKIVLLGKANLARYIMADRSILAKEKIGILTFNRKLKRRGLSEDLVLAQIKRETGICLDLKKNVADILDYAFSEMLNNAIEHSQSPDVEVRISRSDGQIIFYVIDHGVGVFNNIKKKRNLANELEAINDLLKGKQTTLPQGHSGEGIFFTSKLADIFTLVSGGKKLVFSNVLDDIFIQDVKKFYGTKVIFAIAEKSSCHMKKIFTDYAGESYEFSKTKVAVRLYKIGTEYISRSQARRIVSGLDVFKVVVLDFSRVKTVGQAFADEIFRIWQSYHPDIKIFAINANENIDLMILRAKKR